MAETKIPSTATTNEKVRIGDTDSAATSVYGLYLTPEKVSGLIKLGLVEGSELHTANGINIGTTKGQIEHTLNPATAYLSTTEAGGVSDWTNFLTALAYWSKNNSLLYIQVKNESGNNIAKYVVYSTLALATMRARGISIPWEQTAGDTVKITVQLQHFTK
jgi:hypothetical protein